MQKVRDLADPRLIDGCVFCGGADDTRDHVPSRVLLDPPYPADLPVVPACSHCNAGFSQDEEYFACWIECNTVGSTNPGDVSREVIRTILTRRPKIRERIERARQVVDDIVVFEPEAERIKNVVTKLAQGHAVFELSTPLRRAPDVLAWSPLDLLTPESRERFEAAHYPSMIGEVGSRSTLREMVIQVRLKAPDGSERGVGLLMIDWLEVQEGRYRYITYTEHGHTHVRMALGEYLACEAIWCAPEAHGEARARVEMGHPERADVDREDEPTM